MLAQKARFTPGRMKDVGTVAHIYQNYQDMKSAGSQLSKIEERYREALKYCEEESFNELMKDFGAYFTG